MSNRRKRRLSISLGRKDGEKVSLAAAFYHKLVEQAGAHTALVDAQIYTGRPPLTRAERKARVRAALYGRARPETPIDVWNSEEIPGTGGPLGPAVRAVSGLRPSSLVLTESPDA